MTHPNPAYNDLLEWDRVRAAIGQQLRDPIKAAQLQHQISEAFREMARLKELSAELSALLFNCFNATPELRKAHYGQGKWARAGEFMSALNSN